MGSEIAQTAFRQTDVVLIIVERMLKREIAHTAENFALPMVADAGLCQAMLQSGAVELGQTPGTGMPADVDELPDIISL